LVIYTGLGIEYLQADKVDCMKKLFQAVPLAFIILTFILILPRQVIFAQDSVPPIPSFQHDQNLYFESLTIEDGLPEGRVWGITQDNKGFMWFTTWEGVTRYDGFEFIVYKEENNNPNSPGGTAFWPIITDSQGMIWVGSHAGGGLSRYDPLSEQWTRFQHDPSDPESLSSNNIYAIFEDSAGNLWIGTETGGLNLYKGQTPEGRHRFKRYQPNPNDPNSLSALIAASIYEDRSGTLWIGTYGGGLNKFNRQNGTFTHFQNDPNDPTSLGYNHIYQIFEDRYGILWVGTYGGGLDSFNPKTEIFTHYNIINSGLNNLSAVTITGIAEDKAGELWIATFDGGLKHYNRNTDSFTSFQNEPSNPHSIISNSLTSLFVDKHGTIWLGAGGKGISKLDPWAQGFELFINNPANANSLSNNDVRSIFEDKKGDIWIGTWGGLNRINMNTGLYNHYQHDPNDSDSISGNHIWTIEEDHTGVLWVGVDPNGLNKFDRQNGTFSKYKHDPLDPNSLSDGVITRLYEDRNGILWIGTYTGGLNSLDTNKIEEPVQFNRFQYDPGSPTSIGAGMVFAIVEDNENILWVGTASGGLCRLNNNKEDFFCYTNDPNDSSSLSNNTVRVIHPEKGYLWVGTSNGLNKFDIKNERFIRYTEEDGLPHNSVYGLLEDDSGNLWISTANGLSRFNPDTNDFCNYDVGDGLQGNIFNFGAFHKTLNGYLWFGGPQGLNRFDPDQIINNPNIPPVYITDFFFNYEPIKSCSNEVLSCSIMETDNLTLPPDTQMLSFGFTGLNYRNPQKNRYRYIMEGFDNDWKEVDSTYRTATYTNLNPGKYTFNVIGSNNNGLWNEQGASISITISPPWWRTWWFIGSMLILFGGILTSTLHWRESEYKRRNEELEIAVAERTQQLDQRVKEINCLFSISRLRGIPGITLDEILQRTVDLIPTSLQYSKIACARILYHEQEYKTDNYRQTIWQLNENIFSRNKKIGTIQIAYINDKFDNRGDPFLSNEKELLFTIGEQLSYIIEDFQAEKALRLSEQRYVQAQRAAKIGSWDWNISLDHLYWSDESEMMFGFEPGELKNTFEAFLECVHQDDRQLVTDAVKRSIEKGLDYEVEHRIIWPNGTARWLAATGGVVDDLFGDGKHIIGVISDITLKKWTDEKLKESQEEYRILVENISDAIYAADINGVITYMSPVIEILLGYSPDEMIDQSFTQFFLPEDIPRVKRNFELMISGINLDPNEYQIINAKGELRWFRISSQPILERNVVIGLQGVLTDITEGKLYEMEREKVLITEERERLARELHDSVTQTLYTTSLIAEALPLVWESKPIEARQSLEELRLLTQGALAEMRALLVELRPEALLDRSLSELLNQLVAGITSRTESPITLTITDERNLPAKVQIGFYRIAQEALNNIQKHSRADHIWVTLRYNTNGVTLRIKDNGCGFEPQNTKLHQLGMKIMSERSIEIGAEITINSQKGQGTEIIVNWREIGNGNENEKLNPSVMR